MLADPALTALWPQDRSSGLHGPALPDMDFRNRASSNVLSNFVSECGSTDFVEDLARLQAEAAGDDFFLDLGGAAEDRRNSENHWARPLHYGQGDRADSRMLKIPRIASGLVASVIGGADRSWLGLWVVPCGLGGGFLSALVLSSAGRVRIVRA
jgi:hypothetical protein